MPVHVRVAASLSHISKSYKTFFFFMSGRGDKRRRFKGGENERKEGR